MHESPLQHVTNNVKCRLPWVFLALTPLMAADLDLPRMLKDVEARYNSAKTLQVDFQETLVQQGRRRTESGDLSLRKPGRMRWAYNNPQGKLFVSDGKNVYFYSPGSARAEKMKLKETEDMRAPMAFLLGRLEFQKDFKDFRTRLEGTKTLITAVPKSDKLPYREVSFVVADGSRIERLMVTGQDATVLDFTFGNEKLNPKLADTLFLFQTPAGVELVDTTDEARR